MLMSQALLKATVNINDTMPYKDTLIFISVSLWNSPEPGSRSTRLPAWYRFVTDTDIVLPRTNIRDTLVRPSL